MTLPVGTNESAIFFLRLGSNLRQCREEELMARSNSSSSSNVVRNVSAPEQIEVSELH